MTTTGRSQRYGPLPGDDPEMDDYADYNNGNDTIVNVRRNLGGHVAGVLNFLLFLSVVAGAIAVPILTSTGTFTARIDYNTNFYDRDCLSADEHDACQKMFLARDHGVKVGWLLGGTFIAIALAYAVVMLNVWWMHITGTLEDIPSGDAQMWAKTILDRRMNLFGVKFAADGCLGGWVAAISLVEQEQSNGVALFHNSIHLIFDTIVVPIFFSALGVRELYKLIAIGATAFFGVVAMMIVQSRNRTKWSVTNPNIQTDLTTNTGTVNWFLICVYAIVELFIWCAFMVYFWTFPAKARNWYLYLMLVAYGAYVPLRVFYQISYFYYADKRFRNAKVWAIAEIAKGPLTAFGPVVGLFFTLFIGIPLIPIVAFIALASAGGAVYGALQNNYVQMLSRSDAIGAFSMSPRAMFDAFFSLWDIFLVFVVPLLLLVGLKHQDNIAHMLFPITQTLDYTM